MIERLERWILHEAAPCRPDVSSTSVFVPPAPELPSLQSSAAKIAYPSRASATQREFPLIGALIRLKRNVNLHQLETKEICRKWVAFGSPATPDPSPPVSLRDSREGGEGSGLWVRLATHMRGVVKKKQKLKQQQNNSIRPWGTVVVFRVWRFVWSNFGKRVCPW